MIFDTSHCQCLIRISRAAKAKIIYLDGFNNLLSPRLDENEVVDMLLHFIYIKFFSIDLQGEQLIPCPSSLVLNLQL